MKRDQIKHIVSVIAAYFFLSLPYNAYAQSTASKVYSNVKDSVFTIYSIDEDKKLKIARGGAVAIDKNTLATNCHVALSGSFLIIESNNKRYLGKLIYYKQKKDLCLVEVSGITLNPVKIRKSKTANIGEEVFAIGNPEGYKQTISRGIISNKVVEDDVEYLQTDASISHGSSGGGLFDEEGNLIGITTWIDPKGENLGFAIPTELIFAAYTPQTENIPNTTSVIEKQNSSYTTNESQTLDKLGYYGKDEVALLKWKNKCMIGIVGRFKGKPTSLALWQPKINHGFYIFSYVITAEKAMLFLDDLYSEKNYTLKKSKSYLYFDENLYRLDIITINDENQPVYVFSLDKNITQNLLNLNNFTAQIYGYKGGSGLTTITFGLDGFTDALDAYNTKCEQ